MLVTILHILATFQAATPVRPGELDGLCQLLKVTEALPAAESGEIGFHIIETTPEGRKVEEYRYGYAIDGDKMVVLSRGVDEQGRPRGFVTCRNDRHEFELERFRNGWGIKSFGARSGRAPEGLHTYFMMVLHGDMYALQRPEHKVSELLTDPGYRLAAIRLGPRDYLVQGTGPGWARPGLRHWIQEFRCAIRVPPSGRYAYILAATSTCLEDSGPRQDVAEVTNELAEDPDRPRFVRSLSVRVATMSGATYRYETKKTFQVRAGVPEEEKGAFEITHYGLSEPVLIDWAGVPGRAVEQPTNWTPQYLALIALAGLAAVFVGRRLVVRKVTTQTASEGGGER